jgi:hypothetical protein
MCMSAKIMPYMMGSFSTNPYFDYIVSDVII